jgi:hypothetical protein
MTEPAVLGDPFEISAIGITLTSIALDVGQQAARLRALGDSSWTGTAESAATSRIATLPPLLDKAEQSYAAAGAALGVYARSLSAAQDDSLAAVAMASRATADLDAARFAQSTAALADQATLGASALAASYQSAIDDAAIRLQRSKVLNEQAQDLGSAAARTAATALRQASHMGVRNTSWTHRVGHAISSWTSAHWVSTLRVASKVAQAVAVGAGLVALVLALGGAFFPPLELFAAGFEAASLTGAGIAGVADAGLAASGHGSWTTVGADALALAPAGLGRLVSKAAPAAREGRLLIPTTVVHAGSGTSPELSDAIRARWGDPDSLDNHFDRHGGDFGATTVNEYISQSQELLRGGIAGQFPTRIDRTDGVIRIFDPATDRFGSYNQDLTTKTFYRPNPARHGRPSNWAYWLVQRGDLVSRVAH